MRSRNSWIEDSSQAVAEPTRTPAATSLARSTAASSSPARSMPAWRANSSRTVARANAPSAPSSAGARPAACAATRNSCSQSSASASSGSPARYHSIIVNSVRWYGPAPPRASTCRSGRCAAAGRDQALHVVLGRRDRASAVVARRNASRWTSCPGERTRAGVSTSRNPCPRTRRGPPAGSGRAPPASPRDREPPALRARRGRRARGIRRCACRS